MTPIINFFKLTTRKWRDCHFHITSSFSTITSPVNPFCSDLLTQHASQNLNLHILGSGCFPTPTRGCPSTALRIGSEVIIFDAGDGTSQHLVFTEGTCKDVSKIFISKITPAAIFGLPNLIRAARFDTTVDRHRAEPIEVYGPPGLFDFIVNTFEAINFITLPNVHIYEFCLNSSDLQSLPLDKFPWAATEQRKLVGKSQLASSTKHTKLYPDSSGYWMINRNDKQYSIAAGLVSDCTFQPSIGYVVKELDKYGNFDGKRCKALNLTREHFTDLRAGKDIVLNNEIISASSLREPSIAGRKITVINSGYNAEYMINATMNSDVLLHNCYYKQHQTARAEETGYATSQLVGLFGRVSNVKRIVLTGFHRRCSPYSSELAELVNETNQAFQLPNCVVPAVDFMEISIPVGGFIDPNQKFTDTTKKRLVFRGHFGSGAKKRKAKKELTKN